MSTQNNNQINNDIGARIQESVLDALRTGDFSRLNVDITDSVKEVLNGVGDTINNAVSEAKGSASAAARGFTASPAAKPYRDVADIDIARHQAQREALRKRASNRIRFIDKGGVSGVFQIIWGWIFGGTGFLGVIAMLEKADFGGAVFASVFLFCGIMALVKGFGKLKLRSAAKRYKELCQDKMYASVESIASATGTSKEKVVKNIKKILAKGFFPEGYLDEQNTTFMVSKSVYEQYLRTEENRKEIEKEDIKRAEEGKLSIAEQTELDVMITKGRQYTDRLRELNDNIPGEVISNKLSRLEDILNEIFNRVKDHPEQMVNCRKLMDYYLPTMIKLVEAYEEYDKVSQPGDDIKSAKAEIERTLDIINQSFVELLNKLFQSSVWDVTAEAQVLKTMLRQEGLAQDNLGEQRSSASVWTESQEDEEENLFAVQEQVEVPTLHDV